MRLTFQVTYSVLYGAFAPERSTVPTKAFGDIATLEQKELLTQVDGVWRVGFAKRDGFKPQVAVLSGRQKQNETILKRLRWLTEQQVRPEDNHLLAYSRRQVEDVATAVAEARLPAVEGIHIATRKKDELLHQRGWLSVSTVASAKGYDAYCILLAGAHEFPVDVQGRASFYVACTRAIEYLEVFGIGRGPLVGEMEKAMEALT